MSHIFTLARNWEIRPYSTGSYPQSHKRKVLEPQVPAHILPEQLSSKGDFLESPYAAFLAGSEQGSSGFSVPLLWSPCTWPTWRKWGWGSTLGTLLLFWISAWGLWKESSWVPVTLLLGNFPKRMDLGVRRGSFIVYPCSVTSSCSTLCDPIDCSTPGFSVLHYLLEFAQTHVHWANDAISFCISPSNEHSELISFRMDWLDLLAVQGALKSLIQHHNSKASILRCSAFLIVQLYIHTWLLEKP